MEQGVAEAVGMMIKGAVISGANDQDIADRIAAKTGGRVDSGSYGHHILITYPTTQDRAAAAVKIRKMFPGIELYKSGGNRNAIDEQGMAEGMNEPAVDLSLPQYQPVAQPEIDTGARTFAAPGNSSIIGQDLAPSKFNPGSEKTLTSPPAANTSSTVDAGLIGNAFQMAQDDNQKRINDRAAMAANSPADAKQMKLNYQNSIVNPEFMNDLTDPGPETVAPAKPVASTAPVDNNAGATTGSTLRDKINQAAGNQSDNSPLKAPNPVLSSPTQTAPTINKPPAKAPAAGTWQELAQLNKSTNPDPNRIFPGQKIKITPYGDEHIVKPGETLSSIANLYKGLDTPGKHKVRESAAQTDLYQILRNAGLKNTP
jgi:LysM repeat protein